MWFRILTFFSLGMTSSLSWSIAYNLPGDHLAQGQQYLATRFAAQDWYSSASFVGNAESDAIDDTARGFSRAHHKGYGFQSDLTYLLGIMDGFNMGVRIGYAFDKATTRIDDTVGDPFEGELSSEGATDLTLITKIKRHRHSTWDIELDLPICSAESVQSVCTSRPAEPKNSQQSGQAGGQGQGYYGIKLGLSSNWISVSDSHWFGQASIQAFKSDEIYGQKVTAPLTFDAQFGFLSTIEADHKWSMALQVKKKASYSGYSELLETQVQYGEQTHLGIKAEYHWLPFKQVQVKPFVELATRKLPSEQFEENGLARRLEFTTGTQFLMGAQLSAAF